MTDFARYEAPLRRILFELEPYLGDLVIIGGWVPYLYKRYGGFTSWNTGTTRTDEVDVLINPPLYSDGRPTIPEILSRARFEPSGGGGGLAVWMGDIGSGEKLEFLVPHRGVARAEGNIVAVEGQPGIAAIPLWGLELLWRFKQRLRIPITTVEGASGLEIWLPTLGAYVVSKATTYARRDASRPEAASKRAKDLLYLRDLLAAGDDVVARIGSDLDEIALASPQKVWSQHLRGARNMLRLAIDGANERILPEVAQMLVEREPSHTLDRALADVKGHLTDLVDIIDDVLE